MKKKIENDEIDLIEVIVNIWNNKLKIAAITVIFIILSIALYFINKPLLNAKTEIQPISILEQEKYIGLNSIIQSNQNNQNNQNNKIGLVQINKDYLLDLFIDGLRNGDVLKNAFQKFKIIEQDKFENEADYLDAIDKEISKINLLQPVNTDGKKKGEIRLNWIMEYSTKNRAQWEETLEYINGEANNEIKKFLLSLFKFTIQDLKSIKNFELQDIENKIKFVKEDYENEISNRLSFLKEQALIARSMNIETNLDIINSTLEVQEYNNSSTVISNTQTTNPYYLRGFKVIEKEIELIQNRSNKDAFTDGLFELEKQKRELLGDKFLDRVELKLSNTPIKNENKFIAANIKVQGTRFKTSFSLIKTISISGIFGIIFGMFYVLISSAIRQRK